MPLNGIDDPGPDGAIAVLVSLKEKGRQGTRGIKSPSLYWMMVFPTPWTITSHNPRKMILNRIGQKNMNN